MKHEPPNFTQATVEFSARGTRQDPDGTGTTYTLYHHLEIESIGDGSVTTLRLIDPLGINEDILYERMTNIEPSPMVSRKNMKIH